MKKEMQYRPLGLCGTLTSVFGLGGWLTFGGSVTDPKAVGRIVARAFERGVNFFDMADVYARGEAERMLGKALAELPRHELVLSSKVFWPMSDDPNDRGLSRKHVLESVEKSLRRIGTDYLDLYFCHRWDERTPVEETVRAMDDLVRQGKVLYWGTSEWTGAQIREAAMLADRRSCYRPQVEQPQYNLLERAKVEGDVRPVAAAHGMGLVVWSPLASGLLTGKYDEGLPKGSRLERVDWLRAEILTEENRSRVRRFKSVADGLGVSRARLALAWAAAQPGISSVILGVTRLEQLEENLAALEVAITPEVAARLDEIFPPGGAAA